MRNVVPSLSDWIFQSLSDGTTTRCVTGTKTAGMNPAARRLDGCATSQCPAWAAWVVVDWPVSFNFTRARFWAFSRDSSASGVVAFVARADSSEWRTASGLISAAVWRWA